MTPDELKEARALVERGNSLNWHLDHTFQVDALDKETVKGLTDALAAALDENERLREALVWLEAEIKEHGFPKEGPMRSTCRAALKGSDNDR